MKQYLSFRPRNHIVAAILAAWMAVFTVGAAIHHHGALVHSTDQASLAPPTVGGPQPDICLACLASHSPVQGADLPICVPAPLDTERILPVAQDESTLRTVTPTLPSRAPPTPSTTLA